MTDEENFAGVGACGEVGCELLPFGLMIREADFDQSVIGERLVERGNERLAYAIVPDMDDRLEFLRPGFEFAECGFVHAENLKSA